MSQQSMPFFDSAESASKHAIQASGKSIKEVASQLWPGKTVASAQTHLANCLNENRDEKLTTDEHIAIANYCGRYDWLYYASLQCTHTRPEPVTPEAAAGRLQAALFSKADELRAVLNQIDMLKPRMQAAA